MTEDEVVGVVAEAAEAAAHAENEQGPIDPNVSASEVNGADARATEIAGTEIAGTEQRTPRKRRKSAADDQLQLFEINLSDADLPASAMPFELRVEATILLADRPISDARIAEVLGLVPTSTRGTKDGAAETAETSNEDSAAIAGRRREAIRLVREACDTLNQQYAATNRAFRIESVSGGRQMLTIAAFGQIVTRLKGQRAQTRLSQAALETLAIIAYRQPMLRAQLEAIRGVACGEVLKSLMERRLVKIVGRAEEVGRPMLYGTTPEFLRVFGIANLSDLPQAKDLR
ncbi:MAG: SMC-Scp complex subunit ScpB [bacterium]